MKQLILAKAVIECNNHNNVIVVNFVSMPFSGRMEVELTYMSDASNELTSLSRHCSPQLLTHILHVMQLIVSSKLVTL